MVVLQFQDLKNGKVKYSLIKGVGENLHMHFAVETCLLYTGFQDYARDSELG